MISAEIWAPDYTTIQAVCVDQTAQIIIDMANGAHVIPFMDDSGNTSNFLHYMKEALEEIERWWEERNGA